ncbi:MAG: family 16 glycoside hydrolase [Pirellulales bacterium]
MRCNFVCFFFALVFSSFVASAQEPKPPEGFRPLFNGKDLSGWIGLDPHAVDRLGGEKKDQKLAEMKEQFPKHWRVEHGQFVNDGHGPYATTEESFGDYELMIEYKTVAGADSGIYLRGMPQVQIWDSSQAYNPQEPNRSPHLGSGGLFNNSPKTLGRDPIMLADKPLGEWNSFVIKHVGDRVWVKLNTKEVVSGAVLENFFDRTLPAPKSGPIMLQTHGGEIRWRNIFIREIKTAEVKKALATEALPNPTFYNVSYGSHPKQLIHFWKADSSKPAPMLFFVHGGGWTSGGRLNGLEPLLSDFLKAGISVASIEYRFITEATADGVVPPVKATLR